MGMPIFLYLDKYTSAESNLAASKLCSSFELEGILHFVSKRQALRSSKLEVPICEK